MIIMQHIYEIDMDSAYVDERFNFYEIDEEDFDTIQNNEDDVYINDFCYYPDEFRTIGVDL